MATEALSQETSDPPIVTIGLIGALIAIFLAQLIGARAEGGVDDLVVFDLVRFGALNPDLIRAGGDWWRLTTAPLLHGGIWHLGLNAVAMYFGGAFIERHMGGCTLLGVLSAGSFCGALMSYGLGDPWLVSVGASGGIMALLAGSLVLCFTLPEDADTVSGKSLFTRILIPSLIPSHSGVDYAAHFGGALAGAVLAASMFQPSRDPPVRRLIALSAAGAYVAVAVFGVTRLTRAPAPVDFDVMVVIPRQGDPLPALAEPAARALVADKPADPAARLALALALSDIGDKTGAAAQAEIGLRQIRTYGNQKYESLTVPRLKILIALGQSAAGQPEKARLIAAPVCPMLTPDFRSRVDTRGLCL